MAANGLRFLDREEVREEVAVLRGIVIEHLNRQLNSSNDDFVPENIG